ncbi:hypothetical protein GLO73106DRAFT_00038430 [Gloeocapsa sp. PCC 73106]|nr:hypothetical protein GLO73106DRAFT_00022700 [Gloeocapsa sp. PCC 73106]ELR98559.1 hypothetical protein GLO73106DRAFT_00023930 [Gloeocapsa sp. PCC 73106]ELR99329.1 hypothetical protein GLO73106DRAFT_00031790 [Gloeocapsa sp. PCC 73106]ELR99989.1 hypothetical protein GLO73106DRAFT_00038430 [Gloeocapsa sp. PCC 73106]
MKPEQQEKLNYYVEKIAKILYQEAKDGQLQNLEAIEETIRAQTLEYITPQIGVFFSKKPQEQAQVEGDR